MLDESLIIHIRNHKFLIKHLFRLSLIISFIVHITAAGSYLITQNLPSSTMSMENAMDLERQEFEIDIPPELIGGDSNPAPVERQDWVEGSSKTGEDPEEKEINTNQISGDGTDKNGYLFSFNGDMPPKEIVDFDLRQYFPAEAKSANIKQYPVTLLLQIDENGTLITANISSGKAPYGFNEQAIKAVKRMRFSPGYKSGKRVKMAHYLTIRFDLE